MLSSAASPRRFDAGGVAYALAGGFAVSIYTPTESVVVEKHGPQTPQ